MKYKNTRYEPHKNGSSTKSIGDKAEAAAAHYLQKKGHAIIERNWKTRYCEIDIVSENEGTIYFTEVKYRKKPDQGGGLAAITVKKQKQMVFAARVYIQAKKIYDANLLLAAISMTGEPPEVEDFLVVS